MQRSQVGQVVEDLLSSLLGRPYRQQLAFASDKRTPHFAPGSAKKELGAEHRLLVLVPSSASPREAVIPQRFQHGHGPGVHAQDAEQRPPTSVREGDVGQSVVVDVPAKSEEDGELVDL